MAERSHPAHDNAERVGGQRVDGHAVVGDDGHGGRWHAAQERARELVEPRFSRYAAGWGWSSWHLARDLVAISVFVLAHHQHRPPAAITNVDVAGVLGEAVRRIWTTAQSAAYTAIPLGARVRHPAGTTSPKAREGLRGIDLWHAARDAQTETLRHRLAADLTAAGVDLDNDDDALTRTWWWFNHEPHSTPESDRIEVVPEIRQKYLREAAEYTLTLLDVPLPELGGGTAVSDLRRDGWWRGRVEVDDLGRVYVAEEHVAEEPTGPGEPSLGATRTVTIIRADEDTGPDSLAAADVVDALVLPSHISAEHQEPEAAIAESGAVLTAALERAPTARAALREYRPGLWDVIWRQAPDHRVHVEVEPRVPFAAEVLGAALVGWHDWRNHDRNVDRTAGAAFDQATSTVLVRVPTLGEWMPISITPLATS